MKTIRSRSNPTVKALVKLAGSSRERRRTGTTLLEGERLLRAYAQSGGRADTILASDTALADPALRAFVEAFPAGEHLALSDAIFGGISQLASAAGVAAVIRTPEPGALQPGIDSADRRRRRDPAGFPVEELGVRLGAQGGPRGDGRALLSLDPRGRRPRRDRALLSGPDHRHGAARHDLALRPRPQGRRGLAVRQRGSGAHTGREERSQHAGADSHAGTGRVAQRGLGGGDLPVRADPAARLVDPALELELLHDGGGDLLDRLGRRVRPPDSLALHQLLGLLHLVAAVLQFGVLAVGTALVAYLAQALGRDRQAEQLVAVGLEGLGQGHAVEVLRDQRAVRRADAELQREVQAGRGLAAARHADEDHVRLVEVPRRRTVVVRQREVDRLDAVGVALRVVRAVRAPDGVGRLRAELRL